MQSLVDDLACDMSPAFLAAAIENFPNPALTVDWCHVFQLFTTAIDSVHKAEARQRNSPKAARWAMLKARDRTLTRDQRTSLEELKTASFTTAEAYRAEEMLRWIRKATTTQAARWRITDLINQKYDCLDPSPLLDQVRKALRALSVHLDRIIQRWTSCHSNARLEGSNGIFQAARSRASGNRSAATFITIIYPRAPP